MQVQDRPGPHGDSAGAGNGGAAVDFDWIVVGSGFGGSVAALRLSEKGYSTAVFECGRRYRDEDFARTTWNLRRYYWVPRLGLKGIFRMSLFKDVFVVSGCGVGGGSLGYANTLYRPADDSPFYRDPQWADLADWSRALAAHYERAEQMLGVTTYPYEGPADTLLRELAGELGVEHTFTPTRVGICFADPSRGDVPDPYFGGEGPSRAGCVRCGACMLGCRHNAKNTLVKNYLWFAERNGVTIEPERTVVAVRPLDGGDGSSGYEVTTERSGAWVRRDRRVHTARGVIIAAGTLGTNLLLRRCRDGGLLPRVSDRLGSLVRTNSEAISAVTARDDTRDFTNSVAISSSIYPDAATHIEPVTYGPGADSMSLLFTLLAGAGTRLTRPLRLAGAILRHPRDFARTLWPFRWSRRTIIFLTMQTVDGAMRLTGRRSRLTRALRLQTEEDPERPNPRFIPVAYWLTRRAAAKLGGIAQGGNTEAVLNIPTTAHIMGGAVIGRDRATGVVDARQRVFGYRNLLICDGAVVPANIGVNPSLTITALAEHAMSYLPPAQDAAAPSEGSGAAQASG